MSIAFNVNDNLSISWTDGEDTYDAQDNNSSGTATADVDKDTDALQIAYSMGGMSIKAYQNGNFKSRIMILMLQSNQRKVKFFRFSILVIAI